MGEMKGERKVEKRDNNKEDGKETKKNKGGGAVGGGDGAKIKAEEMINIVLKIDMHCEGCARKVKKAVKVFEGVEAVEADLESNKLTVKGKVELNPWKLRDLVEEKIRKKVELVDPPRTPPPPPPQKLPVVDHHRRSSSANDSNIGEGKERKKSDVNKLANDQEASAVVVVLKIRLHCESCMERIQRIILKVKGVQSVTMDAMKDLVTVKGTMDVMNLPDSLTEKLKRSVQIESEKVSGREKKGGGPLQEKTARAQDGEKDKNGDGGVNKREKRVSDADCYGGTNKEKRQGDADIDGGSDKKKRGGAGEKKEKGGDSGGEKKEKGGSWENKKKGGAQQVSVEREKEKGGSNDVSGGDEIEKGGDGGSAEKKEKNDGGENMEKKEKGGGGKKKEKGDAGGAGVGDKKKEVSDNSTKKKEKGGDDDVSSDGQRKEKNENGVDDGKKLQEKGDDHVSSGGEKKEKVCDIGSTEKKEKGGGVGEKSIKEKGGRASEKRKEKGGGGNLSGDKRINSNRVVDETATTLYHGNYDDDACCCHEGHEASSVVDYSYYKPYGYRIEMVHAPQLFSDENPNACSLM